MNALAYERWRGEMRMMRIFTHMKEMGGTGIWV
jgi:hypothetical protein